MHIKPRGGTTLTSTHPPHTQAVNRFNTLSATQMREASREFKEVQNRCTRMNSMVSTLLKQGPVDDATEHHARAALAAASEHEVEEMNPLHLLSAQRNLMVVLAGKAQHADAIEVGEKVLSGYRSLLGPKHPCKHTRILIL